MSDIRTRIIAAIMRCGVPIYTNEMERLADEVIRELHPTKEI